MKKKNNRPIEIEIINYGLYCEWDREGHQLPQFEKLTHEVTADIGVEFGMIVEIRKARNRYLDFVIDHPSFTDDSGTPEPSFTGSFRVKHNPYQFFLGDSIWAPIDNKKGEWTMSILLDGEVLISKTLVLI